MTDMNRVFLMGNLTKDVDDDFAFTSSGVAKASLSLAINRSKKQVEQWVDDTSYFYITVWGKTAENLKPYFKKGQKIAVEGYLKQDRWEKDGKKESRISIIADNVWLAGGKSNSQNSTSVSQSESNFTNETVSDDTFADDIPF